MLFYVNGQKIELSDDHVDVSITLLEYLRSSLRLTGTKLACHEASCGACIVLVSHYDADTNTIVHNSVNACIAPLCSVADKSVTTVECIGSPENLHEIQQHLVDSNGSQCGFCTPGIVMNVYSLLQEMKQISKSDLETALDGNLCRCTGYRPIVDALDRLCNPENCHTGSNGDIEELLNGQVKPKAKCHKKPVEFPIELMTKRPQTLVIGHGNESRMWLRPISLKELLFLKSKHKLNAKLAAGFTELGIEKYYKNSDFQICIATNLVPELNSWKIEPSGLRVGASVTIRNFDKALSQAIESLPSAETASFKEFREQIRWFAGRSVRNVGTIGGNIVTASPISDLNPLHVAFGTLLTLQSETAMRTLPAASFFKSYRTVDCREDEILLSVTIPFSAGKGSYYRAYKVSRRREDDIAIVCAGMRLQVNPFTNTIIDAAFGYGGMAPTTVLATRMANFLIGKTFSLGLFDTIVPIVQTDLPLPDNALGGMAHYRRTLTLSLLLKFFHYVAGSKGPLASLSEYFTRPPSKGLHYFNTDARTKSHVVGVPGAHLAGKLHVTGSAQYTDDIPVLPGALFAALVVSTKPHAIIKSVDWSRALTAPGVHSFLDWKSVPGSNDIGPIVIDEEVFASKEVNCVGAVIGAILADSDSHSQAAAKLVSVEYEILPHILTIEDAIGMESFFKPPHKLALQKGNLEEGFQKSEVVIEGCLKIGGQEHFYMEPQTTVATCGESREIEVYSSTQNPTKTQTYVAKVLGIPKNRVVVKVKRVGGGFGGKETRSCFVSCVAAVGAARTGRQVRCVLPRDVDMSITGTRHEFFGKYRVGLARSGRIQAVDVNLYSNAGCSYDLSIPVMERAVFHAENAYELSAIRCQGFVCRTNTPSNTAFRGFGGPQGMLVAETWMDHAARTIGLDRHDLIRLNMFRCDENVRTYFDQLVLSCPLQQMWSDLFRTAEIDRRKVEIDRFNAENAFAKKGLACIPTKFGMSFTLKMMNQAGALVHCYTDGSVLVSHGGTEMGQGLHTKMCAVAAHEFGIPLDQVHISETATDKVANTHPTAASVSADLNGAAIQDACRQILKRLEPIRQRMSPNSTFAEILTEAHADRINLSANGFYCTPDLDFDFNLGKGRPFNYFAYGVAAAEVRIDCLTGNLLVERVDIIHDVGSSLNPTIDIGQIEGAFVQGYGLFCMEEIVTLPNGLLFTRGPSTYKIPSCSDIPIDFRVTLHQDRPEADRRLSTIHSSKGVGEPPLFLGSSIMFAVKEAIYAYRQDNTYFRLDSPATCERIRLACEDRFTNVTKSSNASTTAK